MHPIGTIPIPITPLAQNVPSPTVYVEVASSPLESPLFSPDSTGADPNLEAAVNDGILRAILLRRTERQEKARACPNITPEHALAGAVMRELKRYLGQPLFITQTGDGVPSQWASDAWIPDEIRIAPDCTDPRNWRCLENPGIPGKTNMNHMRLQFFVEKGKPSFSIAQVEAHVEARQIRVSEPIELPPCDARALCRAVATAKLALGEWSWSPSAASDEHARGLEEILLRSYAIDNCLNRIASWLHATNAQAATPHPGNAEPHPTPP